MKAWKTILGGLLLVALTLLIVVSAMSLAAAESGSRASKFEAATEMQAMDWISATPDVPNPTLEAEREPPTSTVTPGIFEPTSIPLTITNVVSTSTPAIPTKYPQTSGPRTEQAGVSVTVTVDTSPPNMSLPPAVSASPTFCSPPGGWMPYIIRPGDTLQSLSFWSGVPSGDIQRLNCLYEGTLHTGAFLFLPRLPSTPTVQPANRSATSVMRAGCGNTPGWVNYQIRSGDTLFSISRWSGASVADLQSANCMGSSTTLRAGSNLLVPAGRYPLLGSAPTVPQPQALQEPARVNIPIPILPPGQAVLVLFPFPAPVGYWIQGVPPQYIDPNNSAWLPFQPFQILISSKPHPPIPGVQTAWPW